MKASYKKHFKTMALTWAGCFIVFLFVGTLAMGPQRRNKKNIEKLLTVKKQMYNSALTATQEESKFRLNEEIEHLRDRLKDFVTDFDNSANLIFDISQIANEKKVGSFSIRAKGKREGSEIPNCNYIRENLIDVSFTSGFNQFATFLNALEMYRPVIFVDKLTITRASYDNSGHRVRMDLAIFVRKRQDS